MNSSAASFALFNYTHILSLPQHVKGSRNSNIPRAINTPHTYTLVPNKRNQSSLKKTVDPKIGAGNTHDEPEASFSARKQRSSDKTKQDKTRQSKENKATRKKNIVGGQQIQEPTEKTLNGKNWENLSTKETD